MTREGVGASCLLQVSFSAANQPKVRTKIRAVTQLFHKHIERPVKFHTGTFWVLLGPDAYLGFTMTLTTLRSNFGLNSVW
jgi:hypothetical protein